MKKWVVITSILKKDLAVKITLTDIKLCMHITKIGALSYGEDKIDFLKIMK